MRSERPGTSADSSEHDRGLSAGAPAERFRVGLAVLNVSTHAADERPLPWVGGDADWLDEMSIQALTFVARRLAAEPIALVFAVRGVDAGKEPTGQPGLTSVGLRDQDARPLLASKAQVRLDRQMEESCIGGARAAGDTVSTRMSPTVHGLTAHEQQIAQLARTGHTNPEIGAQLFLSPRTVEWHLSRVFAKLNIRSRRELRTALPDPGYAALA